MGESLDERWTIFSDEQKSCPSVSMAHFMAISKESSYAELETLSEHPDPDVRALLASRESTPPQLLAKLASDADPRVRRVVATNHCSPLDSLELLAQDDHIVLRFGLIEELNISNDVLKALVNHRNPYLRKQAYLTLERRDMEELLTQARFEMQPGVSYGLGRLLVDSSLVNNDDIEEAAFMAKVHGMRLGQAIVQSGLLMKEIVISYLLKQSLFRLSKGEP